MTLIYIILSYTIFFFLMTNLAVDKRDNQIYISFVSLSALLTGESLKKAMSCQPQNKQKTFCLIFILIMKTLCMIDQCTDDRSMH